MKVASVHPARTYHYRLRHCIQAVWRMEGSLPVDNEVAAALTGALRSVVSKPDVYLIKAAQLST